MARPRRGRHPGPNHRPRQSNPTAVARKKALDKKVGEVIKQEKAKGPQFTEKMRRRLLNRWKDKVELRHIAAFELGLTSNIVRYTLIGKTAKSQNLFLLKEFLDQFQKDQKSLHRDPAETLWPQPIRFLHLGERIEKALEAGGIDTVMALVRLTPLEITERTVLGIRAAVLIQEQLGPSLRLGMEVPKTGISSTVTTQIEGSDSDVLSAIIALNRFVGTQIKHPNMTVRNRSRSNSTVLNDAVDNETHQFEFEMMVKCGNSQVEVQSRRYQSCKEIAKYLRTVADKIEGIRNREEWDASRVWVSKL